MFTYMYYLSFVRPQVKEKLQPENPTTKLLNRPSQTRVLPNLVKPKLTLVKVLPNPPVVRQTK